MGLVVLVAAAGAAPQFGRPQIVVDQGFVSRGQPEVRIVSQTSDQDEVGNYQFSYELDNGQKVITGRCSLL